MELSMERKLELAQNRNTEGRILVDLALDDNSVVRFYVAKNHSTPAEGLWFLANERDIVEIPLNVARRFKARYNGVFWKLLDHPHYAVRMELAKNPYIPTAVMWELAKDPEWVVRREVAIQANGRHTRILNFLANDECEFVRQAVRENMHFPH